MATCHPDRQHHAKGLCRRCYLKQAKGQINALQRILRKGNRERYRNYERKYEQANQEKVAARKKRWRQKNRIHVQLTAKAWRKRNLEHCKEYNKQYHQRDYLTHGPAIRRRFRQNRLAELHEWRQKEDASESS